MNIQPGLYLKISQLEGANAPNPKPLLSGFTGDYAYRALGGFSLSESGEMFFILSNNDGQIWFISNRHLKTHLLMPDNNEFRIKL